MSEVDAFCMSHLNILCTVHLVIYQLTDIFCEGYRSNHFIVGLTNVSPTVTAPTLWNYTVCGQYPTPVADGATVTMRCTSKHLYYQPHLCRVYSPCGVPQNTCITNHTCVASTHLRCTSAMSAYRYLIVQFPTTDFANFCEVEVNVRCKLGKTFRRRDLRTDLTSTQ